MDIIADARMVESSASWDIGCTCSPSVVPLDATGVNDDGVPGELFDLLLIWEAGVFVRSNVIVGNGEEADIAGTAVEFCP